MTISQAIERIGAVKDSQYDVETMVGWLSDCDGKINEDLRGYHAEHCALERYDPNRMGQELLVPDPYSELYVKYLGAQIDYFNNELERYNNSMVMYNVALSDYYDWYARNNKVVTKTYVRW